MAIQRIRVKTENERYMNFCLEESRGVIELTVDCFEGQQGHFGPTTPPKPVQDVALEFKEVVQKYQARISKLEDKINLVENPDGDFLLTCENQNEILLQLGINVTISKY